MCNLPHEPLLNICYYEVLHPGSGGYMSAGISSIPLGSRGSALAMRQTEIVAELLRQKFPSASLHVKAVQTAGDRNQYQPISTLGEKGVFVRSIEQALLAREIDIAVHSLKDVPSDVETPGLTLAAFSPRADARDVLVSRSGTDLKELPAGSRVGTSSLRRRVQLQAVRPDLVACEIRGNVDTRLRKLNDGRYEAIILAAAGIHRLGMADRITQFLPVELFVPDAGQGIIVLQTRQDDAAEAVARAVDDPLSRAAAIAERATVRALGADCRSPVGAFAQVKGSRLVMHAMAARADGSNLVRLQDEGPLAAAQEIGHRLGLRLQSAQGFAKQW
jgi:hydroxymethylbilane synthase